MENQLIITTRSFSKDVPTEFGNFDLYGYGTEDGKEHVALVKGDITTQGLLCRVHSECVTGEVFGSLRCDCKEQLQIAFEMIAKEGKGIIIYLRQEGRGIGLIEKLKAYELQRAEGLDTLDANLHLGHEGDMRDYTLAAQIMKEIGVNSVRLITNNPDKIKSLETLGITVTERVAVNAKHLNEYNSAYLATKIKKMNHLP